MADETTLREALTDDMLSASASAFEDACKEAVHRTHDWRDAKKAGAAAMRAVLVEALSAARAPTPATGRVWLVKDGHSGLFWRDGGKGYTSGPDVGLFTEVEAKRTEGPSYADRHDKAIPLADYAAHVEAMARELGLLSAARAPVPTTPEDACAFCGHWHCGHGLDGAPCLGWRGRGSGNRNDNCPCKQFVEPAPSPAPQEAETPRWQPIETNLKDGAAFWAYAPALVHADFNPQGTVEACFDGERFVGAVWNGCHDIWQTQIITPTHWMPLPSSPSRASPRKGSSLGSAHDAGAEGAVSK